jgi:hypothetical protein
VLSGSAAQPERMGSLNFSNPNPAHWVKYETMASTQFIMGAPLSVKIFLSAVSNEFRAYRDQLRSDLTRHNVEVKVQEDFKDLGGGTLDKLDVYIDHCDAVVHFIGSMTGADPGEQELLALLTKYPDLDNRLPPLDEVLKNVIAISYTQWEAWLALYHGKRLLIAKAAKSAERGPNYAPLTCRAPHRPRI